MLVDELKVTGGWLFRYRSIVPLLIVPLVAWKLATFTYWQGSHLLTERWQWACFLVSLAGLGVRVATVGFVPAGTSGRNTSCQRADSLNTTGIYSVVRHPLYLGNYIVFLGMMLLLRSWSFVLIGSCLYALYYERIMIAEEAFLQSRFAQAFENWAKETPAFLPRFRSWSTPELTFSLREVLRREGTSWMLVTGIYAMFDFLADSWVEQKLMIDWLWIALFGVSFLVWAGLRTIKRQTRLLHVAGR